MPFYLIGLVTRDRRSLLAGLEAKAGQALRDAAASAGWEAFGTQARGDHAHAVVHIPDGVDPGSAARTLREKTAASLGFPAEGLWEEGATVERVPLTGLAGVLRHMETGDGPADVPPARPERGGRGDS